MRRRTSPTCPPRSPRSRGARQQTGARRVRSGPNGGDRPGRVAERRLRIPVHPLKRDAAGLRGVPAGRRVPAGDRREVFRWSHSRRCGMPRARMRASTPLSVCVKTCSSMSVILRAVTSFRQDPGFRADVRAVGIGLRRAARRLRRRDPEGLPGAGGAGLALAPDAGDSGDAADSAGTRICARR